MFAEFEKYPLPPPWRIVEEENAFINDDTGEVSTIHPYQRLLDRRAAEQEVLNVGVSSSNHSNINSQAVVESKDGKDSTERIYDDGLGKLREDGSDGSLFVGESTSLVENKTADADVSLNNTTLVEKANTETTGDTQRESQQMSAPTSTQALRTKMKGMKYTDFRCVWKELSLMGQTNAYGLTIRYYPD